MIACLGRGRGGAGRVRVRRASRRRAAAPAGVLPLPVVFASHLDPVPPELRVHGRVHPRSVVTRRGAWTERRVDQPDAGFLGRWSSPCSARSPAISSCEPARGPLPCWAASRSRRRWACWRSPAGDPTTGIVVVAIALSGIGMGGAQRLWRRRWRTASAATISGWPERHSSSRAKSARPWA